MATATAAARPVAMGGVVVIGDRPLLPDAVLDLARPPEPGAPVLRVHHRDVTALPPNPGYDGTPEFVRDGTASRCVIPDRFSLSFVEGGDTIEVETMPRARADRVAHLVLDQAVPRLLASRGEVVLHATALAFAGAAVALTGPTGAGKSSLATALREAGWSLVADDCLVVRAGPDGGPLALPSYPAVRVNADTAAALGVGEGTVARAGKWLAATDPAPGPVPLRAVLVLARGGPTAAVAVERVSPAAAAWEVARHTFNASAAGASPTPAEVRDLLERIRPVAAGVTVARLRFPARFDALPDVEAAVRAITA